MATTLLVRLEIELAPCHLFDTILQREAVLKTEMLTKFTVFIQISSDWLQGPRHVALSHGATPTLLASLAATRAQTELSIDGRLLLDAQLVAVTSKLIVYFAHGLLRGRSFDLL